MALLTNKTAFVLSISTGSHYNFLEPFLSSDVTPVNSKQAEVKDKFSLFNCYCFEFSTGLNFYAKLQHKFDPSKFLFTLCQTNQITLQVVSAREFLNIYGTNKHLKKPLIAKIRFVTIYGCNTVAEQLS